MLNDIPPYTNLVERNVGRGRGTRTREVGGGEGDFFHRFVGANDSEEESMAPLLRFSRRRGSKRGNGRGTVSNGEKIDRGGLASRVTGVSV